MWKASGEGKIIIFFFVDDVSRLSTDILASLRTWFSGYAGGLEAPPFGYILFTYEMDEALGSHNAGGTQVLPPQITTIQNHRPWDHHREGRKPSRQFLTALQGIES